MKRPTLRELNSIYNDTMPVEEILDCYFDMLNNYCNNLERENQILRRALEKTCTELKWKSILLPGALKKNYSKKHWLRWSLNDK